MPHANGIDLKSSTPTLVLNAPYRTQRVLDHIERELAACAAFRFYVAFVNQSGLACLIQSLERKKAQGVQGRILVSQYLNFTDPVALKTLRKLPNLDVRVATEGSMHAKGFFFARPDETQRFVIGSSNWTASALKENTELNILLESAPGSRLAKEVDEEFEAQFEKAQPLTDAYLETYQRLYAEAAALRLARLPSPEAVYPIDEEEDEDLPSGVSDIQTEPVRPTLRPSSSGDAPRWRSPVVPNAMQSEALRALAHLRDRGASKALIVSATGTGKTYLSAFDVQAFGARRMLFVVHRENIAKAALRTFKTVFGPTRTYGLLSGSSDIRDADFVFATVQTISRLERLRRYAADTFDYVILDESHRTGAASHQRVIEHFRPQFLLGMTATPERTDGVDIFRNFDHNIAYEIRLHRALEEQMLCPFHYFGVTDLTINGDQVKDTSDFNLLVASERVTRILEKADLYGSYNGVTRGLVFCSRTAEAHRLSAEFNLRGLRTIALDSGSSEQEREAAIQCLEAPKDAPARLDYIFTVDIFNEGVDIPSCNQVILLRPTQSAIVFVQQLGRGLRKLQGEDKYLTVIDFIGNYSQNFLIPVALFGDRSYNKDRIRRLLNSGSGELPGTSTVSFDQISREQIFKSINEANTVRLSDLRSDFDSMRFQLGRLPLMMDFFEHDRRDPRLFGAHQNAGSFYGFSRLIARAEVPELSQLESRVLETLEKYVLNGTSIEEPLLLGILLDGGRATHAETCQAAAGFGAGAFSPRRWDAVVRSVNLRFMRENVGGTMVPVGEALGVTLVDAARDSVQCSAQLQGFLANDCFRRYLLDMQRYAVARFAQELRNTQFVGGFVRYRKYARSDVFRILGASENPVAQNVGGYLIDGENKEWCAVFVTYHKHEGVSATTQYADEFLDPQTISYFSKNRRTLQSPDVRFLQEATSAHRIPLFVKKSDGEGTDFYYLGDMQPIPSEFHEERMADGRGGHVPVVRMTMRLDAPVETGLYAHLTT